ncbi:hypothetical protein BC941DRAFT_265312 [Chlamydoabsidia padenii]|nr:hypothetical protein BC941DRAFT_265312 [Chlamydoabsidia padenii]
MLSNDDDTWGGLEIKDNSFSYHTSRGIYHSYYPDKDLSRACQRVLSPSFYDDDDTLSTSTSLHSDRFSVDDHDYSLSDNEYGPTDGLTTYSIMQQQFLRNPTISSSSYFRLNNKNNNSFTNILKDYEGPGTITRLGRGGRVYIDRGDWTQDLGLSTNTLKLGLMDLKSTQQDKTYQETTVDNKENDPFADFDDDSFFTGQSDISCNKFQQKQACFDPPSSSSDKTIIPTSCWKQEDDDEGFDDLDIPSGHLSLKSRSTPKSSSALFPSTLQKRLEHLKENDEDDFLDGLDIRDEDAFKITPSTINNNDNNKKGESKLPRPKRYPAKVPSPSSSFSSRKKPTIENRLDRLTAPTYASRQRGTPPNSLRSRPNEPTIKSRPSVLNKQRLVSSKLGPDPTFIRTSDGSSLMARPRTTGRVNYGNGSELDHLDDLAVWKRPSMARPALKPVSSSGPKPTLKKSEAAKPWRCNMSKRKLTLIKPDEQKMAKEINDMRYDDREKRWHGNEQAARTFDAPTVKRRPALIKNMMRANKSTAAMVVGDMSFDQQKMTWNTCNGKSEVDALAHIDDLSLSTDDNAPVVVETPQQPTHSIYPAYVDPLPLGATAEFDLPLDIQRLMHQQEHEHGMFFQDWPLRDDCAMTQSPFKHRVPQYTYILY